MVRYTYTSDTGRSFEFACVEAYEAAHKWYSVMPKTKIILFCASQGEEIFVDGKLVEDWAWIAMELYANTLGFDKLEF